MAVLSSPQADPEPTLQDELVRFREEWKKEVQDKKAQITTSPKQETQPIPAEGSRGQPTSPTKRFHHQRKTSKATASTANHVGAAQPPLAGLVSASSDNLSVAPERSLTRHTVAGHTRPINAETKLGRALDIYREAVAAESSGDMDRAIQLYRQSFRLDNNVDKAYQRLVVAQSSSTHRAHPKNPARSPTLAPTKPPFANTHLGPFSTLSQLLDTLPEPWPSQLSFQPEDEREPVHISVLPDELLILVLCHLAWARDVTTIERFGRVNRKTRILSLDGTIWRYLLDSTYKPPQINEDVDPRQLLAERYGNDCRHMYISQPRVRMDGVYIAVCHYIRSGYSDNAWVNMSHLITYHRYLRFLPDGTVLSLLTNDEVPPSQVVSQLKPSFRMKGFYIGTWYLDGTAIYIRDLIDPGGRFVKYGFEMILQLKSRPLGRWNKLDIEEYSSINLETLESVPLALKHERSFWFSKVRSYVSQDLGAT